MDRRSAKASILAPRGRRLAAPLTLLVVSFLIITSSAANAQEQSIYEKWEQVSSLRATGQFDQAIEVLKGIIQENASSDEVLRLAYSNLVYTYYVAGDPAKEEAAAREALERFPDLRADDVQFPSVINDGFERLRREMFGSLVIGKPEEAGVSIDGVLKGNTPINLPLIRVGSHQLVVSKSGYADYADSVQIEPGVVRQLDVSLTRQKDRWWWLTRVGAPVAATVGVVVALLVGGDEEGTTPEPEPLSEPPPPPTR